MVGKYGKVINALLVAETEALDENPGVDDSNKVEEALNDEQGEADAT